MRPDHAGNPPAGPPGGFVGGCDQDTQHRDSTRSADDLLARASRHDYALRVVWERSDGRFCTQLYTTLPAAERKLRTTRERGRHAQVHLVRLVDVQALDTEGVAL